MHYKRIHTMLDVKFTITKAKKKSNATKLASTHNEQYKPNYSDDGLFFILKGKIPRTSINNWRIEF